MAYETKQEFLRNLDNFIRTTEGLSPFRGKTSALKSLRTLRERISRK